MLTANEIGNVKFSKAMGGYRQDEVEAFLGKIQSDYIQFEVIIEEYKEKNSKLEAELKELKDAQDSIQSVLLSAQGLADSIVNEAKVKSEEIIRTAESNITSLTEKEKELSDAFELKAQERKVSLEKELSDMIKKAKKKAEAINAAVADSVARQQMLFDKLKIEMAAFKSSITAKYKEHLEILSQIPDTVPNDPKYLADVVSAEFDKAPAPEDFVSKSQGFVENDFEDNFDSAPQDTQDSDSEDDSDGFKVGDVE